MTTPKGWEIRGKRASAAFVVAVIAAECALACVNLAGRHWLTGAWALFVAAVLTVLLLVVRQMIQVAKILADRLARERIAGRHAAGEDTIVFKRRDVAS